MARKIQVSDEQGKQIVLFEEDDFNSQKTDDLEDDWLQDDDIRLSFRNWRYG